MPPETHGQYNARILHDVLPKVVASECSASSEKSAIGIIRLCYRLRHAPTATSKAEFIWWAVSGENLLEEEYIYTNMKRRELLSMAGVSGVVGLAGCTDLIAGGDEVDTAANLVVESGTQLEMMPQIPVANPSRERPPRKNRVIVWNNNKGGEAHLFDVTISGPDGVLFDGNVRLEEPASLMIFISKEGEYSGSVSLGDETVLKTWEFLYNATTLFEYDGELTVSRQIPAVPRPDD